MAIELSSLTPRRLFARIFPSAGDGREELIAGPLRGELLGAEHLAERARTAARAQKVVLRGRGRGETPLLARLGETRRILADAQARLSAATNEERDVGPAGEWLLDNYHVVQEHIREVRESLPTSYYRELPELAAGPLAGYPRVYEHAITLISHTEGRIDIDNVHLFISAAQSVAPLTIGELWALPAMLRLGLIESVRRMALRTVQRLDEVEAADRWAQRLVESSEAGSEALGRALGEFVYETPPLNAIFVSRFLQQLRLSHGTFAPLMWIEEWIAEEALNADEATSQSTQRLAITQIMMANSITSLRAIARMNWRKFVERESVMDVVLREDPSGDYLRMTFSTRDHYRHVVERIAKRTGEQQVDVARRAIELAREGTSGADDDPRRSHVGYYLVDDGVALLERALGYKPPPGEALHRAVLAHPNVVFVGGVLAGTLIALAAVFWLAGPAALAAAGLVVAFALLPAADIAVNVMNQLVSAFLPPRVLPKLELREEGVPAEFRTAVVIPTLFPSVDAVREALENLEVQFLANREAHLHFALLSDFTDAPTEHRDGDDAIVAAAVEGVRELNTRYGQGAEDSFYLLHRARQWNPREGVWMGWERKRGKLAEFNRFLRGGAADAFSVVVGDVSALHQVRYVITLDSDTVLPPDAAPLLVGALAHPLNRAWYDPAKGRVVRGYGILQPRVGVSLPSAHRSRFAAVHSGHPGVDPYTTAVSDVYQDLYGEGSFTGKGIYDVDAFEKATHGRFPENTLLSHDLIEGSFARAGLATDITVYDDYPTRYLTYTRRKHRWMRGDWQLLDWLTPSVPGAQGREPNRLSVLSKWKIFDNLRRTTIEISQLAFFIAGWTMLPGSILRWTLLAVLAVAAPWIVSLLLAVLRPPFDKSWRAYYAAVGRDAITSAQQVALALTFLPHQAWVSADAIVRTLWRVFVSKRHLLEWQTASQTESATAGDALLAWKMMAPAVALAVVLLGVVAAVHLPEACVRTAAEGWLCDGGWVGTVALAVVPFVLLWIASPVIAHAMSAPAIPGVFRISKGERELAMRYALLHWRFFDRFVGEATGWLAPDNFQEDPTPVVAMRTSPTNIGLQLLSTVSAYDLGFITVDEMARRLELALRSMERMRRFRGHLYNWYALPDLAVLEPGYISTVDSGNLAGHLIALRQACHAIPDDPIVDVRLWRAVEAALGITTDRVRASEGTDDQPTLSRSNIAVAEEPLRLARLALIAARQAASPLSAIDAVAEPLTRAREAIAGVLANVSTGSDHPAAWIDWSLRLLAEQSARLRAFGLTGDREGGPMPTLRELATTSPLAAELVGGLATLAERADDFAREMDFAFLFDDRRKLFSIGYQQNLHALDPSFYDLLASEARLASFIAIAKNDVPVDHWFHLGRSLTHTSGATALVSWSGSMFEYLMPALVMKSYPFTVLDQTYSGVVRRQMSYGIDHGVPWGVSESAYNIRDRHLTYQYRAFGVPDLALKRGLGRDLVVAPYASALAVMVDPERSLANLRTLEGKGALGPFGFRDSLDYTRPQPGHRFAIVGAYMAHHIGMGLVAFANALRNQLWQRRFHADTMVRAAELLLHERIPRRLVLQDTQDTRPDEALPDPELDRPAVREIANPDTALPHIALLGRLPYTIMLSHCGAGYAHYEGLAVTRWRSDGTRDNTGQFCYVKDLTRDRIWSVAHQPVCAPADWFQTLLATDRVTFHRLDGGIETRTEVAVVPEDSAEVRRVTVTNTTDTTRELELTSYGEVVLALPDADRAHPAFANLFVETEWHDWCTAITATRRPRSSKERTVWCVHVAAAGQNTIGPVSCETDRAKFIGRGRTTRDPVAIEHSGALSGTTGAVLDPVIAIRVGMRLEPGQSGTVAFTTLVASDREKAFELADRYNDPHTAQRALDLAWTSTQVELRELGITPADAAIFQELAGHLLYATPAMRSPQGELQRNEGSQQLLWNNGVSGDWPILLATIESADGLPTLRQLFAAHRYWRRRGMTVDLVVINAKESGYLQELNDRIAETMFASSEASIFDRPGGVFIRQRDKLGDADLLMLRATARVHIDCDGRNVGRIIEDMLEVPKLTASELEGLAVRREPAGRGPERVAVSRRGPPMRAASSSASAPVITKPLPPAVVVEPSRYDNGHGGLTTSNDYEIGVRGDHVPPAPWTNVIANANAGFLITERGGGFTWVENSYFFRLTPWHNDPVSDPASEAIYLQDAESGALWSATPAPVRHDIGYIVTHGAGWTRFEHDHDGIASALTLGVAEHDPVKISTLRLTNRGSAPRRIVVTAYAEWTLGVMREHTQHQVHTRFDGGRSAILARNFFDPLFAPMVAFQAISEPVSAHSGNRREFIGRNGTPANPAGLQRRSLSGTTGAGIDPCAALQCEVSLAPGESREIVVIVGAADGEEKATTLIDTYRRVEHAAPAVEATVASWANRLATITVRTPEPSFDAMVNRWTLYQALACRMWGRSALYQSSGAYGFRDQLQDVMAFVYAEPALAREHIVRASGRQFLEGDVQHWWHPHSGRGVRTKFSDDLAWLPYVVDHYIRVTGDTSVLDEYTPFLDMRQLEPHEHEVYDLPRVTDEHASVYEHCLRALRRACTRGAHGLPLIGIGDWNDGMNRVGVEGRGESVWLAWFLITTTRAFAEYADVRGDTAAAAELRMNADQYVTAVETSAWDGDWYRRAYFDNGAPLGSSESDECRIDSIAQSWSIISGAGVPERQVRAMQSFEKHLVREDARLLMLLTPPFDKTPHDPGYIKGYLPGVRENGAQYTHAALWAVLATALSGNGDRAFELYQMINPLTHARTAAEIDAYKVEPYVVAADVYTATGHLGRGGWTWYTGSASWMYRVGLEAILGFTKRAGMLFIEPRVPSSWPEFGIDYTLGGTQYVISVRRAANGDTATRVEIDGTALPDAGIPLVDDGGRHEVIVTASW